MLGDARQASKPPKKDKKSPPSPGTVKRKPLTPSTATGIKSKFMSSPRMSTILRKKSHSKSAQGDGLKPDPAGVARLINQFEREPSPLKLPAPPSNHPRTIGITKPTFPYNPVGKPSAWKKTASQTSQGGAVENNRKPNQAQLDQPRNSST